MNDTHLPDDIHDWPEEPGEILGVDETVDRKTLRRAYSRLVRHFKPEHAPEQFQRIRDAYESMLSEVTWRERYPQFTENDEESGDDTPATNDASESESSGEELPLGVINGGNADVSVSFSHEHGTVAFPDVDDAWNLAATGDLAAAYRTLCEIHERRPGSEEVCIRLYWILRIAPHLDSTRKPLDWLIAALKQSGLDDWALSLYCDELRENPDLADQQHLEDLLQVAASPWQISQLAQAHWMAAATRKDWTVVINSFETLRSLLIDDDLEVWMRMMFNALDYLSWIPSENVEVADAIMTIQSEIRTYYDMQLSMSHDFDRCEYLVNLTDDYQELRSNPSYSSLAEILEIGWNRPCSELRGQLLQLVRPWVENPVEGLETLDAIGDLSPAAVERLNDMLKMIDYTYLYLDDDDPQTALMQSALCHHLSAPQCRTYQSFRTSLLEFCIGESLPLHIVENAIATNPETFALISDELLHTLAEDAPLDCLLRAHLAFWS